MNFPNFTQLYDAKEDLVNAKESILNEWISQQQCSLILGKHSIDPEWFKAYYASAVFDYFMGVVAGDMELGQCPVMKEFIAYLKNQEIRADELFILCSYFKRSVLNATYSLNINSQNLFEFYKTTMSDDYPQLIDELYKPAPDMEKLNAVLLKVQDGEAIVDTKFQEAQKQFATFHKIELEENELQEQFDGE